MSNNLYNYFQKVPKKPSDALGETSATTDDEPITLHEREKKSGKAFYPWKRKGRNGENTVCGLLKKRLKLVAMQISIP